MTKDELAEIRRVAELYNPESDAPMTAAQALRLLDEREALLNALKAIFERLDGDREFVIPDGGAEMLIAARDAIAKAEAE